jgi:hypothetical protein
MRPHPTLAVFLLLSACSGNPGQVLAEHPMLAVVHGTVTRAADGQPVEGAQVRANAFLPSAGGCPGGNGIEVGTSTSAIDGTYSINAEYRPGSDEEEMCLMLEVQPGPASGLMGTQVEGGIFTFRVLRLTPPVDSLRVDVGLDPLN